MPAGWPAWARSRPSPSTCASSSSPWTSCCPGSTTSRSGPPPSPGCSGGPTCPPTARPPRRRGGPPAPPAPRPPGARPAGERLAARGVRFAYAQGRDVLHGVDLDLRPGERLAVVGPSGAGKSTLGRLLAGVNPPRTGSVTVGGVGLDELPLDELRGHVVLVTQEQHVFAGTLRDNLTL